MHAREGNLSKFYYYFCENPCTGTSRVASRLDAGVMDAEVVLGIEKANINYYQGSIDADIKYNSRIAAALRQLYEHQDPIPEEANTGIKDLFIEGYTARLTETDQRFVRCTLPVSKLTEADKSKRSYLKTKCTNASSSTQSVATIPTDLHQGHQCD